MTLRVLALYSLPSVGAGNRLRIEQYVPHLRRSGIEVDLVPFFDDATARILFRPGHTARKAAALFVGSVRRALRLVASGDHDLLLVYRESMPFGPPLIESLWRRRGRPYVFDFDDALYLRAIHPVNQRWSWLRPSSRLDRAVAGARAVIVSTEYLARWARERNPSVAVLPTPVDTSRHRPRPPHRPSERTVIGWTGSTTTAEYLRIIDRPLSVLADRRRVLFRAVGGPYVHPRVPVELRPFTIESEAGEIESFDIGVLPEPDDPWTRGKAGYKALLYMATQVPVVASRVGVNPEVVRHGVDGYVVDTHEDWLEALDRLAGDPPLRQRMGEAGREHVEARYSLTRLAPRLAEILVGAASSGP